MAGLDNVINPSLVKKLLDLASHESTHDNVSLIAIKKAGAHCKSNGKTLGDCLTFDRESLRSLVKTQIPSYLEEIANLEIKLATAEATITELKTNGSVETVYVEKVVEKIVEKIVEVGSGPIGPDEDGYYSWDQFREKIIQVRKKSHGYQAFFASLTKTSLSDIQIMRNKNRVPAKYFDMISQLNPDDYRKPTHQPWTSQEYDRLVELCNSGYKDREVADMLTQEFDRTISIMSVTGSKDRMRKAGRINARRPKEYT